MNARSSADSKIPPFREALRFWIKLGFISFGGPAGQIAIMHTELVEKKKWIDEDRFLHALNFCMLLPGPEAQQLATYMGWVLHRTRGAIAGGVLFVLPSVFVLWGLAYLYMAYGDVSWVAGALQGLKPAVLAIVTAAVIRIGKKALKNNVMWALAATAFIAIYFLRVPFPAIIVTAGFIGWIGSRVRCDLFVTIKGQGEAGTESVIKTRALHRRPLLARSLRVLVISLILWITPILIAGQMLGWKHSIPQEGVFFSKAAMVTFGGAYAVLPYVAQHAVEEKQWLDPQQMLDGLGLAETTPGPLIMVVQFVGFVGAWQQPGDLPPLLAGTLGALLTTWVTFIPCFLWVLLGAPFIERFRGHPGLTGALSTITAAVVGVILNLAVWFGVHVLFPAGQVDVVGAVICVVALLALIRWKVDLLWVVAAGCLLGIVQTALGG